MSLEPGCNWQRIRLGRPRLNAAILCCAALFSGCAKDQYTAHTLPHQYRAKPIVNAQTIDLSRLAVASVSNEFIDKGDVLEVTIAAGLGSADTTTIPVRVREDGEASIPVLGNVELAGLELEAAEAVISSACQYRGLYRAPHVTVTMKRQRTNRITVVGAVEKPGTYELPRNESDLLSAIVAAGGLSEDAGTDVEIRQPKLNGGSSDIRNPPVAGPAEIPGAATVTGFSTPQAATSPAIARQVGKSIRVNLASAAMEGKGGQLIEDGGVIHVERRDPSPVHIIGLVRKPNRYELPVGKEVRVLDAIALAGGVSSPVANKVLISRPVSDTADPAVVTISIREAKRNGEANLKLIPGDVISVEMTPSTVLLDALQIIRFGVSTSLAPLF